MVKDPATDRYTGTKFVADWLAKAMIKLDPDLAGRRDILPRSEFFKTGVNGPRITYSKLDICEADLRGIPFKFVGRAAYILIEGCWVDNLKFLPPSIQKLDIGWGLRGSDGKELDPMEYRYLLLSNIGTLVTDGFGEKIHSDVWQELIMYGRVNGEMPSELIPGKIKQLRELNG